MILHVDDAWVGRTYELSELERLSERAASGHGSVVLLRGEAGIGKSRLVQATLEACRRREVATRVAAASEMEQRRPFGVVLDLFRVADAGAPGRAATRELVLGTTGDGAEGAPTDPEGLEFQVAERVLDHIEELTASSPLALAIEDMQWADSSSLVTLHLLAREAARLPLLLVCSLRTGAPRPHLQSLMNALGKLDVIQLQLQPLTPDEVQELTTLILAAQPGERLLRLLDSANGSPLYVRELLEALRADGVLLPAGDGSVDVVTGQVPASLRQTVLHRLAGLPEPTLELLRTASVLGSNFSIPELTAVLARPAVELVACLRPAISSGVLVATEEGVAFRHELIREAVYGDLPESLRRAQHREVATLLTAAGLPTERVTAHVVLGASRGDREAVDWMRHAAKETAEHAPAVAVDLLQRARDLCMPDDPARAAIMGELVRPLAWASRQGELEALCRRALEGQGRAEDEMTFRMGLGHSLFIQGRIVEAQAAYHEAASSSALANNERAILRAYAALSGVYAGGENAVGPALELVADAPGPLVAGIAYLAVAIAELSAGRADRAVSMFDDLAAHGPEDRWGLQLLRGAALLQLDDVEQARSVLREGARHCLASGTAERTAIYHYNLVAVEYAAGDLDAAMAEHRAGMALAEASGHYWRATSLGLAAAIAVHRGDLEEASATLELGEQEVVAAGPQPGDDEVARARYLLARVGGDAQAAANAAYEAWDCCAGHGFRSCLPWRAVDVVRAAMAIDDRERAEEAATEAGKAAEAALAPCWHAFAAQARGLLGDDVELLLEAVSGFRQSLRPLYLAPALEDAADALARTGRAEEARPLAFEAIELYEAAAAVTDAALARRRLRAAGLPLRARGRRARARSGWESLSESELRVVRLVAEGLTNREIADRLFLSRDTVHSHVSNALRKLALRSRVELAAQAGRRNL